MTDLPDERCSVCFHSIEAHALPISPQDKITPQILPVDDYRQKVSQELLSTERTYVKMLKTCLRVYADPLQTANPPIFPPTLYKAIFLFFRDIVSVNEVFLQSLEELDKKHQLVVGLSSCFLGTLPYLRVYRMFVGNNTTGLQAVDEVEHMKNCEKFLKECARKNTTSDEQIQPLRSYLILPIQRVPRYSLLLSDFLKHTKKEDPFLDEISSLVGSVKALAKDINDEVKLQTNRRKLISIKKRFCEGPYFLELVEAHRYLIREGELKKLGKSQAKKRYFFLFSDLLVYGRMQMGLFYPNRYLKLAAVRVEDGVETNLFNIFSPYESFVVVCQDEESKNMWENDVKIAAAKEKDKKFSNTVDAVGFDAPLYQPYQQADECYICKRRFGLFWTKYHCQRCGFIVCYRCSTKRKIIPPRPMLQRVCDVCAVSADNNVEVFKGLRKQSKMERRRMTMALLE
ncbi:Rho guanine nucleotide exchange factor, putative [Entamoeba invadens IP1]|uniref:Rho guanine nucleotide exchange factor, putative n=1 Tax=Entamoeba invadens IP1 TaxID=370355 RepID=A0A0A1U3S3_ENTIV|nr:Rho guanine nucleotide exchange factor, putative [Entamoeba invadens IP1]ELP88863.1 Rho guanine nucleotide exchange factor, putative [Entamoeba invadens IP1]|eukprot:XP_004255634.1 Rho guanine nucleotide exchange factor, putative [Entamoeba invadens IP1]